MVLLALPVRLGVLWRVEPVLSEARLASEGRLARLAEQRRLPPVRSLRHRPSRSAVPHLPLVRGQAAC